jgi:hypothetical protein
VTITQVRYVLVCGSSPDVRVDFICRIPAHHVLDGLVSSGMELDPGVYFQDAALKYNNMLSLCNEAFNIPPSQDGVLPGQLVFFHGVTARRCGCSGSTAVASLRRHYWDPCSEMSDKVQKQGARSSEGRY